MKRLSAVLVVLFGLTACGGGDEPASLHITTVAASDQGDGRTHTLAQVDAATACDGALRVVASVPASSAANWLPALGYGLWIEVIDATALHRSAMAPLQGPLTTLVADGHFQVSAGALRIIVLGVSPEGFSAEWGVGFLTIHAPTC